MEKIFENWRGFTNEGIVDDVLDALEKTPHKAGEEERLARSAQWQKNPPAGKTDWKKFKQWRDFSRAQEAGLLPISPGAGVQPPEQPEDYEKAKEQYKLKKPQDILQYNCNLLSKEVFSGYGSLFSGQEKRSKVFKCSSLEEATQGTNPGMGRPSEIFKDSKFLKVLGAGAFGHGTLFDNDHVVKFFKGGANRARNSAAQISAELQNYKKLMISQAAGRARSRDLAVYEFGTIPLYNPNAEMEMVDPISFIGYAEMGKVQSFEEWSIEIFGDDESENIEDYLMQIYHNMPALIKYQVGNIKTFDEIVGGEKEYINYILKWFKITPIAVKYFGVFPEVLSRGKGAKFFRDYLTAIYRVAETNGGEFILGPESRDVHTDNFGISYQTGEVVIFDK